MQPHNIPDFIELLRERAYPIDGMRMEVLGKTPNGTQFKGIITMEGEDKFELKWCRWECFLLLFAALEWGYIFKYLIPYCLGFRKMELHEVNSKMGLELQVLRTIR